MTPADWWVLWLGVNELIAGCLYLRQGEHGAGWQWIFYGLACAAWACRTWL